MNKVNRRTVLGGAAVAAAAGGAAYYSGVFSSPSTSGSQPARKIEKSDVIVIGAGLAGLNAALLLEELGHKVTVLEGKDRVGGRLYTMEDVPGMPEAGGSGIGSSYGRILGAMDRYNIDRAPERPRTVAQIENTIINVARQNIKPNEWASHALNPFPEGMRDKMPWSFKYGIYGDNNPLSGPDQFLDPEFAKYDISVFDFLTSKGFSRETIELGAGTNMSYGDARGPYGLSVLMWFNIIAFGRANSGATLPGSPFAGKGGNQRIPEGMAKGLKNEIHMNAKVVGIRSENDQAEVFLDDGTVYKAKRVINTTPFSALRLVDIDAPLEPLQAHAIRALGYTNVTHLHYVPKRKFWENDGMEASMWTDGPTARFMALRNNPESPEEITSFIAFANDRQANLLDRLGPEAANHRVLSYLEQIRPSTKGALEFVKFWSWQLDPFSGGAYAAWQPGQLSTFGKDMSKPAGRLHFAGEHTAVAARGMEGAMESGERAAFEVAELI
ncbi:MAG: hypothetical protein Pars2KO_05160 [Parasphingorhabdus sp.]